MTWIQLPDIFVNLDQAQRIEFSESEPDAAVITWAGGSADQSPHSILQGKSALCLKEALDRLAVDFTEPIYHVVGLEPMEEPCPKP